MRDTEALGEIVGYVDLEATREDDLAVSHDARLKDWITETERHDELRRRRLRGDGGRRRIVCTALGRKAQCNEQRGNEDSARDDAGDDSEPSGEGAHHGA
jgi:hypothetical protein